MAFRSPSFEAVQEAHIGNVVLGRAPVKIISSICAATVEEMIEQAKAIDASGADIIEWRADYYADDASWQKAATAMKAVVSKPILYTFRSQSEGGVRTEPMSNTTWRKKVLAAIDSKLFDAVDIEFDRGRAEFLVEAAHKTGIASIVSWHSFVPGEYDKELGYFGKLEQMSYTGADVLKIVAMPDKGIDIARFIEEVSVIRAEFNAPQPLIAMCMGKTGAVTRVGAAAFGSCATFASVVKSSAPGQLDVETTRKLLDLFAEDSAT